MVFFNNRAVADRKIPTRKINHLPVELLVQGGER